MLALLFLLFTAVLTMESKFNMMHSGLRIAKNCKSMIKDNVHLLNGTKFTKVTIQSISESQGQPYNKQVLTLSNFKVINSDSDFLINSTCSVTDTGILQAVNNKAELAFELTFDWSLKQPITSKSGKASVKMSPQQVNFTQSYHGYNATTLVYVDWKTPEVKFYKPPDAKIQSWCKRLIETKLGEQINLEINKELKDVNEKIIKSYEEYNITEDNENIRSRNSVFNPRGVKKGNDYFIVLNFQTEFIKGNYRYSVNHPLDIPFPEVNDHDYIVCYSTGFFAGYIGFRVLLQTEGKPFLKPLKAENYPSRARFYRSILPGIENTNDYSDDKKVELKFKGDKDIKDLSGKSFDVPTHTDFTMSEKNFLTFETRYKLGYNFTVENDHVKVKLTRADITSFDMKQKVDLEGRLLAMELANSLTEQIIEYNIAGEKGLTVDDIRKSNYTFDSPSDDNNDNSEICMFYKEKTKTAY